MSKRFRYDDSAANLERKVLLSDCELEPNGERSGDIELATSGSSAAINRFKAAREPRISRDIETSDFGGALGTVGGDLLNDVGVKINAGSYNGDPEAQMDDRDGVVTEYEVALKHLGFGPFHVFLMIVNGIAFCADAVEILSLAFVLPLLNKPDEFGISNAEGAVLSSVIFIGMLFGSYIWGSIADIAGRRPTLLLSLTCSGVFGLASAFVPSYWLFTLMRFFSGFG